MFPLLHSFSLSFSVFSPLFSRALSPLRFQWDVKSFLPDFSISPVKGYLCPGMEVPFEVTFSPMELCQDLRYDGLTCTIEGTSPLYLTLTGSCIVPPTAKEVGFSAQH